MDLSLFTKVDVNAFRSDHMNGAKEVRAYKKGYKFTITAALAQEAGFKHGDRLDLYRMGNTFAFKKDPVGLTTFRSLGRAGTLSATSIKLWLATAPHKTDTVVYDAWAEDGVIFFKENER